MAVVLWTTLGLRAPGQHQAAPPQEPLAEMRLRKVAEAYQGLTAYSDQGTLQLTHMRNGQELVLNLAVPLRFVRSESLAWTSSVTSVFADRNSATRVNPDLACQPFTVLAALDFVGVVEPPVPTLDRWTVTPADPEKAQLLGLGGPSLLAALETLMTRPDAAREIRRKSRQLRSWDMQFVHEGHRYWVVEIQPLDQYPPVTVWIDPGTNLVRLLSIPLPPAEDEDASVGMATLQWESVRIATDPAQVRVAIAAANQRLRSTTREFPQLAAPPVAVPSPAVPGEPLPPMPKPGVIASRPGAVAPVAPGKAYPVSPSAVPRQFDGVPPAAVEVPPTSLRNPAGGVPYIMVSWIQPRATGQAPGPGFYPAPSGRSLFQKILCRLRPQDCLPVNAPRR
jgi:hypothetical protein